MITTTSKSNGLISLVQDSIEITNVSKTTGEVTYRFSYEVDVDKATKLGISTVNVNIKSKDSKTSSSIFGLMESTSPQAAVDTLLKSSSLRKTTKVQKDETIIKTKKSDITAKISNKTAKNALSELPIEKKTKTTTTTLSKKESSATNSLPVLQTPVDTSQITNASNESVRQLAYDLVFKEKMPLSAIVDTSQQFYLTEQVAAGTYKKSASSDMSSKKSRSTTLQTLQKYLLGTNKDLISSDDLPVASKVEVPVLQKEEITRVSTSFTLSVNDIANFSNASSTPGQTITSTTAPGLFVLQLEAVDQYGNVLTTSGCYVDHFEMLELSVQPEVVEIIGVGNTFSTESEISDNLVNIDIPNVVDYSPAELAADFSGVNQNVIDFTESVLLENSAIVDLVDDSITNLNSSTRWSEWYSMPTGPISPETATWESLGITADSSAIGAGKEYTSYGSTTTELVTNIAQSNVQFQAASAGTSIMSLAFGHSQSEDFSEIVVPSQLQNMTTANFLLGSTTVAEVDSKTASVSAFCKAGGIEIKVTNVAVPCNIKLLKKNLTKRDKNNSYITSDEPIKFISPDEVVSFVDTSVELNNVYEYSVCIYTKQGREITGTGRAVIEYVELIDNIIDLQITPPKIFYGSDGKLDIQFDLRANVLDTGISAITRLLQEQGLSDLYANELEENKEQLNQLIAFQIDRVNMTKGITEHFNVITTSKFSDKNNQVNSNVSSLKSNCKYAYIIRVLMRSPDTMIQTSTKTLTDSFTKKEYQFNPAKFFNPSTLKTSTIKKEKANNEVLFNEEFRDGFTGCQKIVEVSTSVAKTKIVSASFVKNSRGHNVIKWKAQGVFSDINHFIIIGEKLGMKTFVGKRHFYSKNGTYEFTDAILSKSAGSVNYSIVTVYNDFSFGAPVYAKKR